MSAAPVSSYDGTPGSGSAGGQIRLTADRVRRWTFDSAPFTRRG